MSKRLVIAWVLIGAAMFAFGLAAALEGRL